jgi:hypothetical protein
LDDGIVELPADESLGVEDSVDGVLGGLVLGSISDESLSVGEANVGWGGSVTLIVGDDLDSFVLPDAYTGVGGSEIDSDGSSLNFLISHCRFFYYVW